MMSISRTALALLVFAAGAAPAGAVDLFNNTCRTAGQCALDPPRGGRVFKPLRRDRPSAGIAVNPPLVVPVMPRPRLQVRPSVRDHLRWCSQRYRSYRSSDDTYSPKAGIRRPCVSPFG